MQLHKSCIPVIMMIIWLAVSLQTAAQKRNNTWVFGAKGIDFNVSPAQLITTTGSGTCAVSDRNTGSLLFYSNGKQVWSRNNVLMPNSNGLKPAFLVIIVPFIADTNKYYLFAYEGWGPPKTSYLSYSVIDMSLNGGMGDVISSQKNIIIDSNLSEKVTAVKGAGCYAWLLVHNTTAEFKAYKIDANGLDPVPVVSPSGVFGGGIDYVHGDMTVSPNRKKIAVGNATFPCMLEINDFDHATGVVSNAQLITTQDCVTGVCFRGNNELFTTGVGKLKYYNLSFPANGTIVVNQQVTYGGFLDISNIRMAADKNIYFATLGAVSQQRQLYKIPPAVNAPQITSPPLTPNQFQPGIMGYDVAELYDTTTGVMDDIGMCPGQLLVLKAPSGYQTYSWSTGSTASSVSLSVPGTYWLKVESDICGVFTDTFKVYDDNIPVPPFTIKDSVLCPGEQYYVQAPAGYPKYMWSTGDSTIADTITIPGVHWVKIENNCGLKYSDTFLVKDKNVPIPFFDIPDSVLCKGKTFTVTPPLGAAHYLWSTGGKLPTSTISKTGAYWVELLNECNIGLTDSFHALQPKDVRFDIADTSLCRGTSVIIDAPAGHKSYWWSTGNTNAYITASNSGQYWLQLTNVCDESYTDSFTIEDLNNRVLQPVLGADTFNCMYDRLVPLTLIADTKDISVSTVWSTGDTGSSIIAEQPGAYWVSFFNQCISHSDTINLLGCPPKEIDSIWLPNAFTPNGDGKNDEFRIPFPKYQVVSVELRIYGRFGNEVYRITDVNDGWDGGKCDLGVYYYYLRYKDVTGKEHFQKGDVTLVR